MVLLLSIFYMLISRIIHILQLGFFSNGAKEIVSLAIVIFIGLIYLAAATIYTFRKNNSCRCTWVDIAHLVGGIAYFVGNNCTTLISDYRTEFGCGEECLNSVIFSESVLLGVAGVIPFCIKEYQSRARLPKEKQDSEVTEPEWVLGVESLTLLVEFDSWFTVVGTSSESKLSGNMTCLPDRYTGVTWGFWGFFLLMYMILVYYTLRIQYYDCKLIMNIKLILNWLALWFINFVLCISFGLYLLADNALPLECTGKFKDAYDSYSENIARIFMLIIVLITVGTAAGLLTVYRHFPEWRLAVALNKRFCLNPDDDPEA